MADLGIARSAEEWLLARLGQTPKTTTGWFRAGVGFYNKREYLYAIDCFQKAVELDPLNVCLQHNPPQQV